MYIGVANASRKPIAIPMLSSRLSAVWPHAAGTYTKSPAYCTHVIGCSSAGSLLMTASMYGRMGIVV